MLAALRTHGVVASMVLPGAMNTDSMLAWAHQVLASGEGDPAGGCRFSAVRWAEAAVISIPWAMMIRDGGTTCVAREASGPVQYVTIDFSLPWDGRQRYVFVSDRPFGREEAERLIPDSEQEIQLAGEVLEAAQHAIGAAAVRAYVAGADRARAPSLWGYVCAFLKTYKAERPQWDPWGSG
ncbi:MAG: hypothetical protein FJX66_15775 [Alphaproteobacteria bacterium]|nr:hypothetical protein [Alphaproteobacteria bacterium]